jgi:hypothetical protein
MMAPAANSVNALRHWEQGKRQPEGPTRAYLLVIERAPKPGFPRNIVAHAGHAVSSISHLPGSRPSR